MTCAYTSLIRRDNMKFLGALFSVAFLQLCWAYTGTKASMTKCEKMRREHSRRGGPRVWCDEDGSFSRRQCEFTAKQARCWNVDKKGRKISNDTIYTFVGTRTRSSGRSVSRTGSEPATTASRVTDVVTADEVVETKPRNIKAKMPRARRALTKCEKLRRHRLNRPLRKSTVIPQCTRDGHFRKKQCAVGKNKCWCVNENGKRIPGTKVHNGKPPCYHDFCGKRFIKPSSRKRRVVGGRQAVRNTWPWQALILYSDPRHICGGTLVKKNWLVTAASCFDGVKKDRSEWTVRLGAHRLRSKKRDRISVKTIHIHPRYRQGNGTHPGDYDVALLRVSGSARIPTSTWPLCLPDDTKVFQKGTRCYITGWGHTSYAGTHAKTLQEAWVDLVSLEECNSEKSYHGVVNDRFMCAGYKEGGVDACHFDTGGPLSCPVKGGDWVLAGITSWRQTCAEPRKYGVYTNVHKIKPWIQKTLRLKN